MLLFDSTCKQIKNMSTNCILAVLLMNLLFGLMGCGGGGSENNNSQESSDREIVEDVSPDTEIVEDEVDESIEEPLIADPDLRDCIGEEFLEDIENVTAIDCREGYQIEGYQIYDLSGLELFVNLEELRMHCNCNRALLNDLSPLAGLTKLKVLEISGNSSIPDTALSSLHDLNELRELTIASKIIKDLQPISHLTSLEIVSFPGNILQSNLVEDLAPLANLSLLEELTIHSRFITDLSPLTVHKKLRKLNLVEDSADNYEGVMHDISPITELVNLEELAIGHYSAVSKIDSIDGLEVLTNLRKLTLANTKVSNIEPIAAFTELEYLNLLGAVEIVSFSPLENLTKLESLSISENFMITKQNLLLHDIRFLAKMTKMRELDLERFQLFDISPIQGMLDLEVLEFGYNTIQDISPIANFKNLKVLSLTRNYIEDISVLEGLTNLEKLFLARNDIVSINSLEQLTQLDRLSLSDNPIFDLSPLYGFSNNKLSELYLNKIEASCDDIEQLLNLDVSDYVTISSNQC